MPLVFRAQQAHLNILYGSYILLLRPKIRGTPENMCVCVCVRLQFGSLVFAWSLGPKSSCEHINVVAGPEVLGHISKPEGSRCLRVQA